MVLHSIRHTQVLPRRTGAFLALAGIVLMAMLALAAFAINLAYLELSRTELRLANDAAAKAAIVRLGQTQSVAEARRLAREVAAAHQVAGRVYTLADNDLEFGNSTRNAQGRYDFVANRQPLNSVRVSGGRNNTFNFLFGNETFSIRNSTIATRVDHDICLVIDRSGSMAWDLSNERYAYPGELRGKSRLQTYFSPPHPTGSRWAAMRNAVNEFNNVISLNTAEIQVGLVTYSSDYTFGDYNSQRVTTNQDLTLNRGQITSALATIGQRPIIGDTNIQAGLQVGMNLLTNSGNARVTASKTLILLSDGRVTEGGDPIEVARAARAANMRVHTIAFSNQADISLMQRIAEAGGGNYYFASDAGGLRNAFRQIAEAIPSIITN